MTTTSKRKKLIEEKETIEQVSSIPKHVEYDYYSDFEDFEDFEDDSSNDEGFASGQTTSMSDMMSPADMATNQFTPRLATMLEEDEENEETDTEQYLKDEDVTNGNERKAFALISNEDTFGAKLDIAEYKPDLFAEEQARDILLQPYVSIRTAYFKISLRLISCSYNIHGSNCQDMTIISKDSSLIHTAHHYTNTAQIITFHLPG